jgi:propionate CoA-transferase
MKLLTALEAAALVPDGATLASSGFRFAGAPEELLWAVGERFRRDGGPRDLRLVFSSAQGDNNGHGLDHLAQIGLLREVVGGFYGTTPILRDLILDNRIRGYNLPQGQLTLLYRAIAAGQPGVITHIGLGTFVDPRIEGGRLNASTTEDLVEVVNLSGREWLHYKAFPIDVCLLRASSSDENGNLSFEREAVQLEALPLATATRNSGGLVIAQVERLVGARTLDPKRVVVPGHLVDVVVVSERPDECHQQALGERYNPAYSGEIRAPQHHLPSIPFSIRKVIARRAAQELVPGTVVNLGQGMPEGVALVAQELGIMDQLWTSLESGVIGGVPTKHVNFGVAVNPQAIIRHDDQFVFYNGGGVNMAFLGFAQTDTSGAINVSRFGKQFVGCGGFIDLCQRTQRLIFMGQFDAGKADVSVGGGRVEVRRHGTRKFVNKVDQITLPARAAVIEGRRVTLVTERAVFELTPDGWQLTEIAPGVDVERDVLSQMDFRPVVREVRCMPEGLFLE